MERACIVIPCYNEAGRLKEEVFLAFLQEHADADFCFVNDGSSDKSGEMLQAMALQIPIRNFIAMSMGVMSEKMAMGLLDILNDDRSTFKGFCRILAGIPGAIPKLGPLLKSI